MGVGIQSGYMAERKNIKVDAEVFDELEAHKGSQTWDGFFLNLLEAADSSNAKVRLAQDERDTIREMFKEELERHDAD